MKRICALCGSCDMKLILPLAGSTAAVTVPFWITTLNPYLQFALVILGIAVAAATLWIKALEIRERRGK